METFYVHALWLFTSAIGLLVTFGAATTALSRVMFQIYKKDEPTAVFSLFFKTFKDEFVVSTGVWFLIIVLGIPLFAMGYRSFQDDQLLLLIMAIFIAFHLLMVLFYSFPVIAIFTTKNFFQLLKNIVLLEVRFFFKNVLILGHFSIIIFLAYFVRQEFIIVIGFTYGLITTIHLRKPFAMLKENILKKGDNKNEILKL